MLSKNIRSSPAHVFNTKAAPLKVWNAQRPRCVPQVRAFDQAALTTVGVVGFVSVVPPGGAAGFTQ